MHLKTASIRRSEASSSSFFFFILPTDLYILKGAFPEKLDYNHLQEWGFVVYGWFCASLHTATSRALWFFQTEDSSCVHPYTNSSSASSCCSRNWDYWHSSMRRVIFLKLLTPPYWRSWMPSMLYVTFFADICCEICCAGICYANYIGSFRFGRNSWFKHMGA